MDRIDITIEKILNYGRIMTEEEQTTVFLLKKKIKNKIKKIKEEENKNSPTVKELFQSVDFKNVQECARDRFGKRIDMVFGENRQIFEYIKSQGDYKTDSIIHYTSQGGVKWDVYSTNVDSVVHFGVDLILYKEIANMKVGKESIEKFSKEEIVAAFLEEFSWHPQDESKISYEEQLEEIKESMKNKEFEKECEENDVTPITINKNKSMESDEIYYTVEEFMKEATEGVEEKNGETLREFINNTNAKKVKEEFIKIVETFDEKILLITKEKASEFFNENYFVMMNAVNQKEKNVLEQNVKTDITVDYLMTTLEDVDMNCIYNGKKAIDIVDEKMEEDYMYLLSTEEQIVAEFFFAYHSESLTKHQERCYDEEEMFAFIQKKNKARKIFKRIFEDYDIIERMKKEELETVYYYLEICID